MDMPFSKATEKAVKDVVSKKYIRVIVIVAIAVSYLGKIDTEKNQDLFASRKKEYNGGLKTSGFYLLDFGDVDYSIEVVIACIEVEIEKKNGRE